MRKLWLLTFLILFGLFSVVHAKQMPFVEDPQTEWSDLSNPTPITDVLANNGLYGRLGMYGDVDAFNYTFDAPAVNFPVSLKVPSCGDHFTPFYPSVAVVGEGLESTSTETLPFELPEGYGVQVMVEEERLDPRPTELGIFEEAYYASTTFFINIPQSGEYFVVVWEPDGHTGAYSLSTGNEEPNFNGISNVELDARFNLITTREWMGQDCSAPLTVENCTATTSEALIVPEITFPERSDVGDDYMLLGEVRDAETCLPIAASEVAFWLTDDTGAVVDDYAGRLFTNQQGAYRVDSNRVDSNRVDGVAALSQIHVEVSAPGYQSIVTTYHILSEENEGYLSIALMPE
jgi:hypothetical protein